MRFPRSLRKSIAAALVFTTLTVPMAGCDFLDDLFDDDKPNGKPPAGSSRKKDEAKLPQGAFVVKMPRVNNERFVVEAVGMDALRYYVHARVATKKLSRMNAKNSKIEEYVKFFKETAALWERAELFANAAQKLGAALAKKEKKPGYKPLAMTDDPLFGREIFFSVAYAREGTDEDEARFPVNRSDFDFKEGTLHWANDIKKTYENHLFHNDSRRNGGCLCFSCLCRGRQRLSGDRGYMVNRFRRDQGSR